MADNPGKEGRAADGTDRFDLEVNLGNVEGVSRRGVGGSNPAVVGATIETIWTQGGRLVFLTADTQLFASSTDTDDDQIWLAAGIDDNYEPVTRLVTLNGQTQVALSGLMFRVEVFLNIDSTNSDGDVFLAESDTLTAGKPDTASKIKMKALAGTQAEVIAVFTARANTIIYTFQLEGTVGRGKNAIIQISSTAFGGVPVLTFPFHINETDFSFFNRGGFTAGEKTDVEFVVSTADTSTPVSSFNVFYQIDVPPLT